MGDISIPKNPTGTSNRGEGIIPIQELEKLIAPAIPSPTPRAPTEKAPQREFDHNRLYEAAIPAELKDPNRVVGIPIAPQNATTFGCLTLPELAELKRRDRDRIFHPSEAEYVRYGTPITRRVESRLAKLDGGEMALVFPSGMAAIEKVIDSLIPNTPLQKAHFIVGIEGYRQTRNILDRFVSRGWIELTAIPMDHFDRVHQYLKPNTAAVFFETPSNPFLRVIDVAKVKKQIVEAKSNALVVVDHTFASPANQKPLEQGADLVVPSLTKYVSGNNQVLAGAVVGSEKLLLPILTLRGQSAIARDDECLRLEEGMATLEERIDVSNRNGALVANLLASNPNVLKMWYPGHPSHPDHQTALEQMKGFGGVVTFRLRARDYFDIEAFVDAAMAALPKGTFIGPSFGGEFPIISAVALVSHFPQTPAEMRAQGITFDLIRLYTGTIDPQILTGALDAGFKALERRRGIV